MEKTQTRKEIASTLIRRRDALTHLWRRALYGTSYVPLNTAQIDERLAHIVSGLIEIVIGDDLDTLKARDLGANVAQLHYIDPEAFGRTLETLAGEILRDLSAEQTVELLPRLTAVMGHIASGYFESARTTILHEQEEIRQALMAQLRTTYRALHAAHDDLEHMVEERTAELVTTNKRLQEENTRREYAETAYRALVENSFQALMIVQGDRLVYGNDRVTELTGHSLSILQSMPVEKLFDIVHPEDRERLRAISEDPPPTTQLEYRGIRPDGSVYWAELYLSQITFNGEPAIQAVILDITDRKAAEEAKRRSEAQYRLLIDLLPDMVVAHREGKIVLANQAAARIFGVDSPAELVGQPVLSLAHPDYREQHAQRLERLLLGESIPPIETKIAQPYGRPPLEVELRTVLIEDHGQPTVLVVGRDITQRNAAERELQKAHDELEQRVEERTAEVRQRNTQLYLLNEASRAFTASLELEDVLTVILERLREELAADAWFVWLVEVTSGALVCEHYASTADVNFEGYRQAADTGLLKRVVNEGQSLCFGDVTADSDHPAVRSRSDGLVKRSLLAVPLRIKDHIIGAIEVVDAEPYSFGAPELELLEMLTAPAAIAIENARLYTAARHEVQERRHAEAALRASETRYRTLIEASPDAILVTDLDGIVQMSNKRAAEMLGLQSTQQTLGSDLLTDYVIPEDREIARARIDSAVENGSIGSFEIRVRRSDGSVFPVEISANCLYDAQGHPRSVISTARDLTARKQIENALRLSNAELRALNTIATQTGQSEDLSGLMEPALREASELIEIAAGWITLTDAPDHNLPTGCSVGEFSPCRQSLREALTQRVMESGATTVAQTPDPATLLPLPDYTGQAEGEWAALGLPIRAQQRTIGVFGVIGGKLDRGSHRFLKSVVQQIGIAADNALLAQAAAEVRLLREIDQLRSDMVASFSHDLKTPLGVIKFSSTTLLRDDVNFSSETQRELLKEIDEQTDQLEHIVERVLGLGHLESGSLELNRDTVDLARLTRETVNSTGRGLHKHTITQHFTPATIFADVDRQRIIEVLHNLLDNAVKYSPAGGEIHLRGRLVNGEVEISVQDEGIGIPEADLERIFERFYRGTGEIHKHTAGVGLGLAVCRGIIDAHDGRIWAESTLGEGTTIRFRLPAITVEG
jgi:PAS domain S-box-containing protein